MILVGQGNNRVEIEFHTKVVCCIWGCFFNTRLVQIRKVLSITEHSSSNNLPSFAINAGTKWLRSRFIFSIKTLLPDYRGRAMKTLNCCRCFSEIQPLWLLMQKQDCSSIPFCEMAAPCWCLSALHHSPTQPKWVGSWRHLLHNILIFLNWKAACRELKRDQFLNTAFKCWFNNTDW